MLGFILYMVGHRKANKIKSFPAEYYKLIWGMKLIHTMPSENSEDGKKEVSLVLKVQLFIGIHFLWVEILLHASSGLL